VKKWFFTHCALFVGSYAVFRQTNTVFWQRDKQTCVIFPASLPALYFFWRPLTFLDSAATGMLIHIGL
jgi:hypothetical protein